jgi:hypothetical protein
VRVADASVAYGAGGCGVADGLVPCITSWRARKNGGAGGYGVADGLVPVVDGELGGDAGGPAFVAVFHDFEEAAAFFVRQDGRAPVAEYEQAGSGEGVHQPRVASVAFCAREGLEEPGRAVVDAAEELEGPDMRPCPAGQIL